MYLGHKFTAAEYFMDPENSGNGNLAGPRVDYRVTEHSGLGILLTIVHAGFCKND